MGEDAVPCVELREVTKRFSNVVAVDRVSLRVEKGEIFSILGPSGCGKTTTLRLIGGFETPDEGEILLDGKLVNDLPPYKRDCSIVFQRLALFPHMTVEENIAFGLEQRRVPKGEIKKKIEEMLDLVKLSGLERRRPDQLSGGQQQRVALARSLVIQPKVLLLDEPLASLDRKLRKEMQVELKQIQREVGITFLYITHDQKEALAISDRIGVMKEGKLVQIGSPDEIYERPRTRFVADFMGAPNIFSGKVVAIDERKIQIKTGSGLLIKVPSDREIVAGRDLSIAIRPERIRILPEGSQEEGDNQFRGKITTVTYQGDFMELEILLLQGDRVVVHLPIRLGQSQALQLKEGDEVSICWDAGDGNILVD